MTPTQDSAAAEGASSRSPDLRAGSTDGIEPGADLRLCRVAATGRRATTWSVLVLGDDLGAKLPLDQGHAGEVVHRRRGRHVLVVRVKVLVVRWRGRRERWHVAAAHDGTPDRVRASALAVS